MQKCDSRRVLVVDDSSDRKERVAVLKENGFTVYPALNLEQARKRCTPGKFDLIIVNARMNPDLAVPLCDGIIAENHEQSLLLIAAPNLQVPRRPYLVSDGEVLLYRINRLLAVDVHPESMVEAA